MEATALSSFVPRCSFFTRNPSLRFLDSGGVIMSSQIRIEDHPKLGVAFLLDLIKLQDQVFVRCHYLP